MKNILLLFILGLSFFTATAQFGPQQIITTNSSSAFSIIPYDINQDEFMDIISGSSNKIVWHQNQDGQGDFSEEQIIVENIQSLGGIILSDFDNDGDVDIIYKEFQNKIIWLENLNGLGDFGPKQILIESHPDYRVSSSVEDMDNDGDKDLIVNYTNTFNNYIVWYENLDGQGTLSDEILLIENLKEAYGPIIVDIDNDGNLDLLTSHENNGPAKLVWYRNLGNVVFGQEQEIYQFDFFQSDWTSISYMQYVNINSDEDKDIVITAHNDDLGTFTYWLENLDNQGEFSSINLISNVVGFYRFYDLNNDGDNDLLGLSSGGDRIYWKESENSQGTFNSQINISTEVNFPRDIRASDINGNGLLDVISASSGDNKIAWYENEVLGLVDQSENHFTLYPNPTEGQLNINSNQEIILIEVYNLIGQKILETKTEFNISNFNSGIYFVKIKDTNGFSEVHKIIKE